MVRTDMFTQIIIIKITHLHTMSRNSIMQEGTQLFDLLSGYI